MRHFSTRLMSSESVARTALRKRHASFTESQRHEVIDFQTTSLTGGRFSRAKQQDTGDSNNWMAEAVEAEEDHHEQVGIAADRTCLPSSLRKSFLNRIPAIEEDSITPRAKLIMNDWKRLDERLNYAKVHPTFLNYFTKNGHFPMLQFAQVQTKLRLRYQDSSPIPRVVKAIRPLVLFTKGRGVDMKPKILAHNRQHSIAAKWVFDDMMGKTIKKHVNRAQALTRVFEDLVEGRSTIYQKRYQMHRAGFK